MQSSAISTMLDLIILTQSVQVESQSGSHGVSHGTSHDQAAADDNKSVQILPTLHHNHLKYLAEQTNFFTVRNSTDDQLSFN